MKYGFLLFTIVLVLILSSALLAQPGFPGGGNPPVEAPIDGGLGLLAAAGGAYAVKKLRGKRKQEEDNTDL